MVRQSTKRRFFSLMTIKVGLIRLILQIKTSSPCRHYHHTHLFVFVFSSKDRECIQITFDTYLLKEDFYS